MTYGDYISKATREQREEVRARVVAIIGDKARATALATDLTDKIQRAADWDKAYEKLAKVFFEHGEKALALHYQQTGRDFHGVTASGKKWVLYGNDGLTRRSRYCGTLYIEDVGTVFTSGRLEKVFDYILNN